MTDDRVAKVAAGSKMNAEQERAAKTPEGFWNGQMSDEERAKLIELAQPEHLRGDYHRSKANGE